FSQAFSHAPQCARSRWTLVHTPPQTSGWSAGQLSGLFLPQSPSPHNGAQDDEYSFSFTQFSPQRLCPTAQETHCPAVQIALDLHSTAR
ncbi:MAG: hypothetical protein AAGJ35_12535, partial [Myxococcota bacterium]